MLNCPVTIYVALESVLGSLREYIYQLFGVLSLVSVHKRKYSLKLLSMHRINGTRLHRALFFEEGGCIEWYTYKVVELAGEGRSSTGLPCLVLVYQLVAREQ